MGIVFTTRGWTGASIVVHHADGDDTFAVTGDVQNAGDVAQAFRAWLDHISRPWSGSVSFVELVVRDDASGRVAFDLFGDDSFDVSDGNAVWQSRMGVMNSYDSNTVFGATRGSCSAVPGTVMWERWDTELGGRNRRGSFRSGHPTLAPRRPTVELAMDLAQAYAFNESLRLAPDPRRAYVFDEVLDDYRMCVIGEAVLGPLSEDDATKVVGTLEVVGEVA